VGGPAKAATTAGSKRGTRPSKAKPAVVKANRKQKGSAKAEKEKRTVMAAKKGAKKGAKKAKKGAKKGKKK
jgi:hypothetical protein